MFKSGIWSVIRQENPAGVLLVQITRLLPKGGIGGEFIFSGSLCFRCLLLHGGIGGGAQGEHKAGVEGGIHLLSRYL